MKNWRVFNMKRMLFLILLIAGLYAAPDSSDLQNDPGFKLYSNGYVFVIKKQWRSAINTFDTLIRRHPHSQYQDDAHFWIAYAYDQLGNLDVAFEQYQLFLDRFPESKYIDKVKNERITIAKLKAIQKQEKYVFFLEQGADFKEDISILLNKKTFYQQLVKDVDGIILSNRANIAQVESQRSTLNPARANQLETRLQEKQTFFQKRKQGFQQIIAATEMELNRIFDRIGPFASPDDIDNIFRTEKSMQLDFNEAYAHINRKEWSQAKRKFQSFVRRYPYAMLKPHAELWIQCADAELGNKLNAFAKLEVIMTKTNSPKIREEAKLHRIRIALNLAASGNKDALAFLETGADFKQELAELVNYLVQYSDRQQLASLNSLIRQDLRQLSQTRDTDRAIASQLVGKINAISDKLQPYYGEFHISLERLSTVSE